MTQEPKKHGIQVQSVARALEIIRCFERTPELGLSELEPYQITYVNRCGGDMIVTTESTPTEGGILEGITDTIGSALEYLRISFNKN